MDPSNFRQQSIIFKTQYGWTTSTARDWLLKHNLSPMRLSTSWSGNLHYRLEDPKHFNSLRTIDLGNGIDIIFGFPKDKKSNRLGVLKFA